MQGLYPLVEILLRSRVHLLEFGNYYQCPSGRVELITFRGPAFQIWDLLPGADGGTELYQRVPSTVPVSAYNNILLINSLETIEEPYGQNDRSVYLFYIMGE